MSVGSLADVMSARDFYGLLSVRDIYPNYNLPIIFLLRAINCDIFFFGYRFRSILIIIKN